MFTFCAEIDYLITDAFHDIIDFLAM